MRRIAILLVLAWLVPFAARASSRPVEIHQLLALSQPGTQVAALTLDACGGGYDARLIRFLVEPGAQVQRGDPLYELDTDKVTQEVEAEADGVLLEVVGRDGEEYAVGAIASGGVRVVIQIPARAATR